MSYVFISYRHEGAEHVRGVRRLGELLREAGIHVELDQFYLEKHPAGPDEGWPKWCEDRAGKSDCVLIIGSTGWFAAYEKTGEAGVGLGAATEAHILRQRFFNQQGVSKGVRFGYLHAGIEGSAPLGFQGLQPFRFFQAYSSELDRLIKWISGCLGLDNIQSPTVRWPAPLPDFKPDIANRNHSEWPAIQNMLSGRSQKRILFLEAESGYGKTELLHQAIGYAKQAGLPIAHLDFRANFNDTGAILGQICADFGEFLPNFSREGGSKPHLLIQDLRSLRQPVLLIVDTFEKATEVFQNWVCQNILAKVERSLALSVIVAGQPRLPDVQDVRWRTIAQHLPLGPIQDAEHWEPWIERRFPRVLERKADLPTLVMLSGGVPRAFSDLCRVIAGQVVPPSC